MVMYLVNPHKTPLWCRLEQDRILVKNEKTNRYDDGAVRWSSTGTRSQSWLLFVNIANIAGVA